MTKTHHVPINPEAPAYSLYDMISPDAPRWLEIHKAIEEARAGRRRPFAFRGEFR